MTTMSTRIDGKVVLLTGATGGLGSATARRIADEGGNLVLTDLDLAACEALAESLEDTPGRHTAMALDVAVEDQWSDVAGMVDREYGSIHALINNEAIGSIATVEAKSVEHWNRVMAIGATGVWLGMKHCGPRIAASGGGSIVNLSSILGTVGGFGNSAAYHSAKGAVRTLTKNAALHWAPAGVRVNSLHPGFIGTEQLLGRYEGSERHAAMLSGTPMGRLGRSDEIAAVVAFLVSDDSTFMTGSEVYADGGWTAA